MDWAYGLLLGVIAQEELKLLGVFAVLLFGGEMGLVPILLMVSLGVLELPTTLVLLLFAILIPDGFWYLVGRFAGDEKIRSLPLLRRHPETVSMLSNKFSAHMLTILFVSKFIFGTRAIVQVLCGVHRMPLWQYILVAIAATLCWVVLIYGVILLLQGIFPVEDTVRLLQILLPALIAFIFGIHLFAKRFVLPRVLDESKE